MRALYKSLIVKKEINIFRPLEKTEYSESSSSKG